MSEKTTHKMTVNLRGLFHNCGSDYNSLHRHLEYMIKTDKISKDDAFEVEELANELRNDIVGLLCIVHPETGTDLFTDGFEIEDWWSDEDAD